MGSALIPYTCKYTNTIFRTLRSLDQKKKKRERRVTLTDVRQFQRYGFDTQTSHDLHMLSLCETVYTSIIIVLGRMQRNIQQ